MLHTFRNEFAHKACPRVGGDNSGTLRKVRHVDTKIFRYHVHVVCVCLAAPGVGACGAHGGRAAVLLTRRLLLSPRHRDGPESGV